MRQRTSTQMLALAALMLLGCDQATNATYRGPALAELRGRMTLKGELTHDLPVRLAVVWYPLDSRASVGPKGVPTAIATDELTYSGVFPQDFTLQVFDVPVKQPCTSVCALGAVVAYQDLNGNGRLDVSTEGAVIDHVVGSSWLPETYPSLAQADQQVLAYFDAPTEWQQGIISPAGFSLLRVGPDAANEQPPTTLRLNLVLQEEPRLDLLICRDYFFQPKHSPVCGIAFIDGPRVEARLLAADLTVAGSAMASNVLVWEGPWETTEALVSVNGVPGHPTEPRGYEVTPREGDNLVRVELPGYPATEFHVFMPRAQFVGLRDGQLIDAGARFEVQWETAPHLGAGLDVSSGGETVYSGPSPDGGRLETVFTMPPGDAGVDVVAWLYWQDWGALWQADSLTRVQVHLVARP